MGGQQLNRHLPNFQLKDEDYPDRETVLYPPSNTSFDVSTLYNLLNRVKQDGIKISGPKGFQETRHVVAFDMEWKPNFVRGGAENKTAVIQIAGQKLTVIILLSLIPSWYNNQQAILPEPLHQFLINPKIIKTGVAIRNDGLKLLRDAGPDCRVLSHLNGFIELSQFVTYCDPNSFPGHPGNQLISLQRIVAQILRLYLPKGKIRTSDWSAPLTQSQVDYAACDVVAAIRVFRKLLDTYQNRLNRYPPLDRFIQSLDPTYNSQTKGNHLVKSSGTSSVSDILSPRVQQTWRLWYQQELDVYECACEMSVHPMTAATYLAKALIAHVKTLGSCPDEERAKEEIHRYRLDTRYPIEAFGMTRE